MRNFLKSTKGKVTIAVIALLFGFMLQSARSGNLGTIGSRVIGFITTPFTATANAVSNGLNGFFGLFQGSKHYKEENQKLQEEVEELRNKQIEYEEVKKENEAFKQQLEIKEKNPSFKMVTAQVTIRNVNEKFYSFKINKGSDDGVGVKNAVITKEGLVGIVTEVGKDYSEVKTILDPSISVGTLVSEERATGMVEGDLNLWKQNKSRVKHIARENKIKDGDKVVTSGESKYYPKNIMVGTISEITHDENALLMTGVLTPSVDIVNVRQVQVITNFEKDAPAQE